MKYLLLIFIILSPLKIYSQSLVEEDIAILINGFDDIQNAYVAFSNSNDDSWEKFYKLADELDDNLFKLFSGDMNDNEFIHLKKLYQEFINYNPLNEIDNVFKSIGWKVDGHKKYSIISCYFLLTEEYFPGDEVYEARLLNLFNKQDFKLMNRYREELIECLR